MTTLKNETMLDQTTFAQRLTTLEQTVLDLQRKVNNQPNSENWLETLIGSISDESAFSEALDYGRRFRQIDQPIIDPKCE
ncbi:MAG: hypothetical protein RLZZ568_569 [Cyanobacteriota bacterium]